MLKKCFLGVECLYELEKEKSWLLSLATDTLTATDVPLLRSSGSSLCPELGYWDATYLTVTDDESKVPVYVAAL